MAQDTAHTQHNARSRHTSEQESSGAGYRTRVTTHRACTPLNRSQVAQDTAHTQRNTPSGHISEQEPSGPGHRSHNTTRQASRPLNRSQMPQETRALASTAPRHSWLGCSSVCVRAPLVPRHSWLGCAVCMCVLGLRFWLRPATSGWGVGVCVCSCARSACTLPLLAGVRSVGGCAWALASAAPRHSWPGCWGVRVRAPLVPRHSWLGCAVWVCVLGLGSRLRPATLEWGVGVCVPSCAPSSRTAPLLAGVFSVGVCAWVRVLLRPTTPGWGVGMCVCAPLCAPLVPCHSWLGCAVWVCGCGLKFRLRPASPGRGVGSPCLCARSACTPPLLAGRAVWLCLLGSGFGCAPPLLAGLLGCVCVCVRALLLPRRSWLGCVVWVGVLGLLLCLRPATPGWGVGECVCALCLYPPTSG